jgi:Fe-S cluster assembly iron-binding protein IscA
LGLALDEPLDNEERVLVDGIPVRVDPQIAVYAADCVVDYEDSPWGKGLTIRLSRGGC